MFDIREAENGDLHVLATSEAEAGKVMAIIPKDSYTSYPSYQLMTARMVAVSPDMLENGRTSAAIATDIIGPELLGKDAKQVDPDCTRIQRSVAENSRQLAHLALLDAAFSKSVMHFMMTGKDDALRKLAEEACQLDAMEA